MKGRDHGKLQPAADMMVCFPTRAHLRLMPKPICSPARPPEIGRHRRRNSHHMRSSSIRAAGSGGGYGWSPNLDISEPSSPKVTCAGQIKVRPRRIPCENWQSVMEEFERMQSNRKQRRSAWSEALRFVTCLRNLRLDFRCFGGVQEAEITSDEDEEDDDHRKKTDQIASESRRVYSSNWYMIVKEENDEDEADDYNFHKSDETPETGDEPAAAPPPPNALLLMRCRSTPAKSWQEEEEDTKQKAKLDKEEGKSKKGVVIMRCEDNFSKFSADVAEETWLVGGVRDIILPRSKSCSR